MGEDGLKFERCWKELRKRRMANVLDRRKESSARDGVWLGVEGSLAFVAALVLVCIACSAASLTRGSSRGICGILVVLAVAITILCFLLSKKNNKFVSTSYSNDIANRISYLEQLASDYCKVGLIGYDIIAGQLTRELDRRKNVRNVVVPAIVAVVVALVSLVMDVCASAFEVIIVAGQTDVYFMLLGAAGLAMLGLAMAVSTVVCALFDHLSGRTLDDLRSMINDVEALKELSSRGVCQAP